MKRILITSDDGFDSIGVKLLVRALKDDFELKIAGTKAQMSGVGGYVSLGGGTWQVKEVDGVEAMAVEGTPVDAVECANVYFGKQFNFVVSGINWGENVSASQITSGTLAAAWRALFLNLAKKSLAISWKVPLKYIQYKHDGDAVLEKRFWEHPGKTAGWMVRQTVKHNGWGVPLLNINLPEKATKKIRFTRFWPNIDTYYCPVELEENTGRFTYPKRYARKIDRDTHYDTGALWEGYISVTPCQRDMLDRDMWRKMKQISDA